MPPTAWALASMWSHAWDAPRFRGQNRVQNPVLSRESLAPLLKIAASCVTALLPHVFGEDQTTTAPHGASRELLVAAMDGDPAGVALADPTGNPVGFVRTLAKAAFMTGDGELIDGLSEERLDKLMDVHCASQLEYAGQLLKDVNAALRSAMEAARLAVEELASQPLKAGDLGWAADRLVLKQQLDRISEDAQGLLRASEAAEEVSDDMEEVCNLSQGIVKTEDDEDTLMRTQTVTSPTSQASTTSTAMSCAQQSPPAPEVTGADAEEQPPLKRTKSQLAKQLKVEKVKKHQDELREPILELRRTTSLMASQAQEASEIEKVKAELAAVEQARKRALNFSEDLVEDMVTLDGLAGLTPEDRSTRKATISGIEALLQDVDVAKTRLAAIQRTLEERLKSLEEKQAAELRQAERLQESQAKAREVAKAMKKGYPGEKIIEEEPVSSPKGPQPTPRTRAQQGAAAARSALEPPPPGREVWQKVRLPLEFHTAEAADCYILTATVPGLETEDLKLQLSDDNKLTVGGLRLPSKQESMQMRKRIAQQIQLLAQKDPAQFAKRLPVIHQVAMDAYVELGAGQFGRFSSTFALPDDVDVDRIDASYRDGTLRIVLPKIAPRPAPATFRAPHGRFVGNRAGYPRGGYPGPTADVPFHGGLFGGTDDWFRW